jgi:hypothetical protein
MTMKPRLKNVTAEDVLNCLYYLHVDMPDDVLLLEGHADLNDAEVIQSPPKARIARKPLREDPSLSDPSVPATLPENSGPASPNHLGKPEQPPRDLQMPPETPHWMPPLPERPPPERKTSPVRRPLGPRALHSQPQLGQRPFPGIENAPLRNLNVPAATGPQLNIALPKAQLSNSAASLTGMKNMNEFLTPTLNTAAPSINKPLSIRLIRRDPTSGAQWNIGGIQCQTHLNSKAPNSAKLGSSVSVHLTTLGYGQFQSIQDGEGNEDAPKLDGSPVTQTGFNRQINMDWSNNWGGKFKQHRRGISDQSGDQQPTRIRSSTEISGLKHERYDIPNPHVPKVPDRGFISPWNGLCEFSTGSSGRTLKCKHILSSYTAVASDTKAAVSELRFNLPSNVYSTSRNTPKRSSRPSSQHMRSKSSVDSSSSPRSPKADPTSYAAIYPSEDDEEEDEDDDPNDGLDPLSLGREKAGGGIRGKRVKLGKLIVHDEGLKMLDLVVAANMGMWWTIWDG